MLHFEMLCLTSGNGAIRPGKQLSGCFNQDQIMKSSRVRALFIFLPCHLDLIWMSGELEVLSQPWVSGVGVGAPGRRGKLMGGHGLWFLLPLLVRPCGRSCELPVAWCPLIPAANRSSSLAGTRDTAVHTSDTSQCDLSQF